MLCLFSEISVFPLEILVGGCGSVGGNYTLIESFRLLHPGTQCPIVHLKHKCKFIIFASSNFAELTLFHVMVDDRQKCYAFPEQQENKTLK